MSFNTPEQRSAKGVERLVIRSALWFEGKLDSWRSTRSIATQPRVGANRLVQATLGAAIVGLGLVAVCQGGFKPDAQPTLQVNTTRSGEYGAGVENPDMKLRKYSALSMGEFTIGNYSDSLLDVRVNLGGVGAMMRNPNVLSGLFLQQYPVILMFDGSLSNPSGVRQFTQLLEQERPSLLPMINTRTNTSPVFSGISTVDAMRRVNERLQRGYQGQGVNNLLSIELSNALARSLSVNPELIGDFFQKDNKELPVNVYATNILPLQNGLRRD